MRVRPRPRNPIANRATGFVRITQLYTHAKQKEDGDLREGERVVCDLRPDPIALLKRHRLHKVPAVKMKVDGNGDCAGNGNGDGDGVVMVMMMEMRMTVVLLLQCCARTVNPSSATH